MDFSVWGVIKNRVFAARPTTQDQLRALIVAEFARLDAGYCRRTVFNVTQRMHRCQNLGGAQVERSSRAIVNFIRGQVAVI
jgi:hypothetical protein